MIGFSEILSIFVAFALFLFLIRIFVRATKSMALALIAWTNIVFIMNAMDNYSAFVAHLHVAVEAIKYVRDISFR